MPQIQFSLSLNQIFLIVGALILIVVLVILIRRAMRPKPVDLVIKDSYSQLEIHRRVFPETRPADRRILNLIYDNSLTNEGDLLRRAHITLKVESAEFNGFMWRVPHIVEGVYPFGIRVISTSRALAFEIDHSVGERVTQVWIPIDGAQPGQVYSFTIEYIQEHFATLLQRRLIWDNWQFDWAYTFVSQTDYFEMRVYLPKTSRVNLRSIRNTLKEDEHITRIGDDVLYISSHTNPGTRPASGKFAYQVWSPALPGTLSLAAGLVLALPLSFLGQISWQGALGIFIIVSAGVFAAHRLTERLV